jgi:hypothetical protein
MREKKWAKEESEIRGGRQSFSTQVRAPLAGYLRLAVICQSSFASIVSDSSCFWSVDASVEFSWWWFLASYLTALFAEISALIYLITHLTHILLILALLWHCPIDYLSINSLNHARRRHCPSDWLKIVIFVGERLRSERLSAVVSGSFWIEKFVEWLGNQPEPHIFSFILSNSRDSLA